VNTAHYNLPVADRFGNGLAFIGSVSSSGGNSETDHMKTFKCKVCGKRKKRTRFNQAYCPGKCRINGNSRRVKTRLKHLRIPISYRTARTVDLVGRRFGKLLVVKRAIPAKDSLGNRMWVVRCDCGTSLIRATGDLIARCRHCGCSFPKAENSATWKGYGGIAGRVLSYFRIRARKDGCAFNLTCKFLWELYLKQNKQCAVSGMPITLLPVTSGWVSRKRPFVAASIDRINPKLGYTKNNVQWTSLAINYMKRDHSMADFVMLCRAVSKRQPK
jgi:hypothetical protein